MSFLNSAFDVLWIILGWVALVLVALGAAILVFAVLVGLWRGVLAITKRKE